MSLVFVVLIYFTCCMLIYYYHNVAILSVCVIIFGILDQWIWVMTTYVISYLYPVKTNLLISACFAGISFSIFIWANFATCYINKDNISMSFLYEITPIPDDILLIFHDRICNFFFYHGLLMILLFALIVFKFNINETSKVDVGAFLTDFYEKRIEYLCCPNRKNSKSRISKNPMQNRYLVNS